MLRDILTFTAMVLAFAAYWIFLYWAFTSLT